MCLRPSPRQRKLGFLQAIPLPFCRYQVTFKGHSNLPFFEEKKKSRLQFYLQSSLSLVLKDGFSVKLEMNYLEAVTQELYSFWNIYFVNFLFLFVLNTEGLHNVLEKKKLDTIKTLLAWIFFKWDMNLSTSY